MSIALHIGDCRAVLATLPAASVHCVVTSPPYWGLRDYGTATWEGGDPACGHIKGRARQDQDRETPGGRGGSFRGGNKFYTHDCICGARRIDAQLGLEPDFNTYVANMVGVFREVRRVLRDDGTLWLNLGDSYAGGGHGGGGSYADERHWRNSNPEKNGGNSNRDGLGRVTGLKPKDLCGIPWRVALALQADGWYLRQDIIWSKPNPMPESVTDRCTKSHEYIFLLSKRERYYYDAEAIAEPLLSSTLERGYTAAYMDGKETGKSFAAPVEVRAKANWRANPYIPATRNKRSVWEVTTQPFSEAHFATFPPALIEPCIKAGCPVGGTVLDPFGGAGTTGLVADRLQRNAILIELNPAYAAMSSNRIKDDAPLFAEVAQP